MNHPGKTAKYFESLKDKAVRCVLCPHNCIIPDSKAGICLVRKNYDGILVSEVYERPVAVHSDPIEKKPLYHFFPGQQVLSLGTFGCNLKCEFCQNCEISQKYTPGRNINPEMSIEELTELALMKERNIGLAYTYNEPVVFFEYMMDLAYRIRNKGMKNVMVSNGYINPAPLDDLLEIIDAFNIDLKSFSHDFYRKHTKSSLEPVLRTIGTISRANRHLELTFMVIPGLNDGPEEFVNMINWIVDVCGNDTVLHISRYFPAYKMAIPPTPVKTLEQLYTIAKQKLNYVYLGNVNGSDGGNTYCPACKSLVISRSGYFTTIEGLGQGGACKKCGEPIIKNI